jgi:predicted nucleic acid-binding protein
MLADTSAWIEFVRDGHQATADRLESMLETGEACITEPVVLEVLQGGRSEAHVRSLQGLLWRARLLTVESGDYAEAAFLYRVCRANGVTVRSSLDCLIAAVAIRTGVPVLHHDRDFDLLARHTPLVAQRG